MGVSCLALHLSFVFAVGPCLRFFVVCFVWLLLVSCCLLLLVFGWLFCVVYCLLFVVCGL